jgi:MraZ protein
MRSRKTQYAWMAIGGLLSLFCLGLFWMWHDGNRVVAQNTPPTAAKPEVPPPPGSLYDLPEDPPPLKEKATPKATLPPPGEEKKPEKAPKPVSPLDPLLAAPPLPPKADLPAPSPKPSLPPLDGKTVNQASPPPLPDAKLVPPLSPPSGIGSAPEKSPKSPPHADVEPPRSGDAKPPEAPQPADVAAPPPSARSDVPARKPAPTEALPGEPPLAPAPGPVQNYQVRGNETMRDIAKKTLGSADRWSDIHKLNPMLKPDIVLASGTTVRLPGEACIADDPEPLKPLPVMHPKAGPAKPRIVLPLTGTYPANLDDKKAMTLPAGIRDQLGSADMLLVSPGPDQCLWLTNQAQLDRLAQRLENSPAHETEVRVFKRLYFAQTEKAPLSPEGRVRIPERLAQFAGLHQEVVLVGIDDHFEVWDATRWRDYTQQKSGVHPGD